MKNMIHWTILKTFKKNLKKGEFVFMLTPSIYLVRKKYKANPESFPNLWGYELGIAWLLWEAALELIIDKSNAR